MQINYNNRLSEKTSIKRKVINFLIFIIITLLGLFILSKFNFPAPKQEIKKNITNEIIKLK